LHLIQAWLVDLLRGLGFLHDVLEWIHCDIKPANLLISDSLQLRIADMGGVRFMEKPCNYRESDEEIYTITYRAPELLDPECYTYTSSVDMWAVGCVLLDLLFCPSATPIRDRSTSDAVLAVHTTMLQHNRELTGCCSFGKPTV
jgi:serine/threonine protein kinase